MQFIAASIAAGIAALGASIGNGMVISKTLEGASARNGRDLAWYDVHRCWLDRSCSDYFCCYCLHVDASLILSHQ